MSSSSSSSVPQRFEEDSLVLLALLACAAQPNSYMMEYCMDFLSCLDSDTSLKILMCLDDPADLVRVSCVSRSWRQFVIEKGLFKQLCLRMFPQLSRVVHVVELNPDGAKEHEEVGTSNSMEWLALERDHRVFTCLARISTQHIDMNCLASTIAASSTDNFPQESIDNTLEPRDFESGRYSYWSSNGQSNPDVPETLTYKLVSQICVIKEINIQPFEARFQLGSPIYSAKAVRFKMGHLKAPLDDSVDGEKFVWTYISPEFPMTQENRLQKFRLPKPVLCIGGIFQIELLGRVQRQEMDGLLYICVSHVQVVGCSLSPAFSVEILEPPSGRFMLNRDLQYQGQTIMIPEEEENIEPRVDGVFMVNGFQVFPQIEIHDFPQIVGGQVIAVEEEWDEYEYELDEFEEDYAL